MDATDVLTREDIRSTDMNLPFCLDVKVKSLQFCLKCFQEKGLLSIDGSFECSSIEELIFRKFINEPTTIYQISSGMDTRPVPLPSRKCSLKDVLSDSASSFSDLNSYFPSLASILEESDSFLDSIQRASSSLSENYDISSSTSSSFASEDDLTSCSSRDKINFDPSIFEN